MLLKIYWSCSQLLDINNACTYTIATIIRKMSLVLPKQYFFKHY